MLGGADAVQERVGHGAIPARSVEHRGAQVEREPPGLIGGGRQFLLLEGDRLGQVDRDAGVVGAGPGVDLGDVRRGPGAGARSPFSAAGAAWASATASSSTGSVDSSSSAAGAAGGIGEGSGAAGGSGRRAGGAPGDGGAFRVALATGDGSSPASRRIAAASDAPCDAPAFEARAASRRAASRSDSTAENR